MSLAAKTALPSPAASLHVVVVASVQVQVNAVDVVPFFMRVKVHPRAALPEVALVTTVKALAVPATGMGSAAFPDAPVMNPVVKKKDAPLVAVVEPPPPPRV